MATTRKIRRALAGLVLAVMGMATAFAGDGITEPLKVLAIGNSFSQSMYRQLPAVAQDRGLKLDLMNLYKGGCSLKEHWDYHDRTGLYEKFDRSYVSSPSPVASLTIGASPLDAVLEADQWDIVTLQQNSANSASLSTYEPYFGNLVALIREKVPDAEIVIQQTWSWNEPKTPDSDAMYDALQANYAAMAEKYNLRMIPTGYAVQIYRHEFNANPLSTDNQHLSNPAGDYMQACVWLEKLFGADARTVTYTPSGVGEESARKLRLAAHQAVEATDLTAYRSYEPTINFTAPEFGTTAEGAWGRSYPVTANDTLEQVIVFTGTTRDWTFTLPDGVTRLSYLVVGGGGAGGTCDGGGGAGGGFQTGVREVAENAQVTVTVGKGGIGQGQKNAASRIPGPAGADSVLTLDAVEELRSAGGGGGGAYNGTNGEENGRGSFGGGDAYKYQIGSVGPNGTAGGMSYHQYAGGGGAGAGGDGEATGGEYVGGAGGAGLASDITGESRFYAAGGGGGVGGGDTKSTPGLGGSGVGGNGGRESGTQYATSGAANTGSGGGGGGKNLICLAGSGADGIVVLRYGAPEGLTFHRVTFNDWDGTELSSGLVVSGKAALPPVPPTREGYKFVSWDVDFASVTKDLVVTATYVESVDTDYGTLARYTDDDGRVFRVATATKNGTITIPEDVCAVDLLVVGGGAGGGGLGGGAGGAVYERLGAPMTPGAYAVTIGAGGKGADTPFLIGGNGGTSSVTGSGFAVSAEGGGTGRGWNEATMTPAANGGGGSPSVNYNNGSFPGLAGTPAPDAWHHQGFSGGNATNYSQQGKGCGGAGGGAGANGNGQDSQVENTGENNDETVESAGAGGAGWTSSITGKAVTYGGGGGGGVRRSNYKLGGAGGLGGGGSGATGTEDGVKAGTPGVDGLGGGGGGGGWDAAGNALAGQKGGDGVVIVRYARISENAAEKIHAVTFKDGETVLATVSVLDGCAAVPPAVTEDEFHTFLGWDTDVSSVTADLTVTARFEERVRVRFYHGETLLDEAVIARGSYVTLPSVEVPEGYELERWEPSVDGPVMAHTDFQVIFSQPVAGERLAKDWGYDYELMVGKRKFYVSVVTNVTQSWSIPRPDKAMSLAALLVGGGGGGGGQGGGGGGAVYYRDGLAVPSEPITITVGKGGAGAVKGSKEAPFLVGKNGGTTSIAATGLSVTALGGGTGAGWDTDTNSTGANGGGGSPKTDGTRAPGKGVAAPDEWHHQGFTGGTATNYKSSGTGCGAAGGGAGAGENGGNSQVKNTTAHNDPNVESAGKGGDGWACGITGTRVVYGGGGGGGVRRSNYKLGGEGGLGGGGSGATAICDADGVPTGAGVQAGTPGVDGLGGGGGGGGWDKDGGAGYVGQKGGDGIVVLRWSIRGPGLFIIVR